MTTLEGIGMVMYMTNDSVFGLGGIDLLRSGRASTDLLLPTHPQHAAVSM